MSVSFPTLNYNEPRLIAWKGKTFNQIISTIQRNVSAYPYTNKTGSTPAIFLSPPLKIYRREIVTAPLANCNETISSSIDVFDQPGSTIVNSKSSQTIQNNSGLVETLDFNLTSNTTDRPGLCNSFTTNGLCLDNAKNARNRVRSSGMIRKKYNTTNNNDTYYTSVGQYLVSRNRTFQQNQYNYIRQGDANAKPGTPSTVQNVYSTGSIEHCSKYTLVNPTSFKYQWLDGVYYNVNIPSGVYDIDDLNLVFQQVMLTNGHYYITISNQVKVFLLKFAYSTLQNKIQLQCFRSDRVVFPPTSYNYPSGATWRTPNYTIVPLFVILNNEFSSMIGFPGSNTTINYVLPEDPSKFKYTVQYPSQEIRNLPIGQSQSYVYQYIGVNPPSGLIYQIPAYTTDQFFDSISYAAMQRNYVPVYYKPNNSQFAQQGGVSASSYITRLKYDSITNNTAKYQKAYGNNVANAYAYGVSDSVYSIKDKIGYPNKCTPNINGWNNGQNYICPKMFNG